MVGTLLASQCLPTAVCTADSGTHHTLACSVGSQAWGFPRRKVLKGETGANYQLMKRPQGKLGGEKRRHLWPFMSS